MQIWATQRWSAALATQTREGSGKTLVTIIARAGALKKLNI